MENFEFRFKGDRTYVHGTDIYMSVREYFENQYGENWDKLNMSIHKLTSHHLLGEVVDAWPLSSTIEPAVVCRFETKTYTKVLYLVESDSIIQERYAYDEDSVVRNAIISSDMQVISLLNDTAFAPIEVIVALNKKLMQRVFATQKGKWLFSQLKLKSRLPKAGLAMYRIQFKQGVGTRLTCSSIMIDDKPYGEIYFSMVKDSK